MARYTVSLKLDCRVDVEVEVEADSFEEAFKKAEFAVYDWNEVEVVGDEIVSATNARGEMKEYC